MTGNVNYKSIGELGFDSNGDAAEFLQDVVHVLGSHDPMVELNSPLGRRMGLPPDTGPTNQYIAELRKLVDNLYRAASGGMLHLLAHPLAYDRNQRSFVPAYGTSLDYIRMRAGAALRLISALGT